MKTSSKHPSSPRDTETREDRSGAAGRGDGSRLARRGSTACVDEGRLTRRGSTEPTHR